MTTPPASPHPSEAPVLVTGGCGFLGCNIAKTLAARGHSVLVLDSLVRRGASENANWLMQEASGLIDIKVGDVRDANLVDLLVSKASAVLHLAAQVAVTNSVDDPLYDFEVNARGTLNLLEAVRCFNPSAPVLFASTNKVYGRLLTEAQVIRAETRYRVMDGALASGVSEETPIDLYSPYGCSKGVADQYVRDYARIYGLRTAVLRMSCIYGPRQFGTEDQGWMAHFLLRAIRDEEITIYGDGFQVRDALYVDDAVDAWLSVLQRIDDVSGSIFNVGGGTGNSLSLRELVHIIGLLRGRQPRVKFADWRPGDQPWYVTNHCRISKALDWTPRTDISTGLHELEGWLDSRFGAAAAPELQETHV